MSSSLESFIKSITQAATIEEEREIIANEQANMRTFVHDCQDHYKPRVVAKLLFLTMRSESTSWGEMEIVSLMTNERTSYKRIGYLAAGVMLDEFNERIVLITATVQRDMGSPNPAVQVMALNLIANIASAEMAQSVSTDVLKLCESPNSRVQKAAGMACVRIIRKCPEIFDQFRPVVARYLNHGVHSVVTSGIHIAVEMLKVDPNLAESWVSFAGPFTKILKTLFESRPQPEFAFSIFNDPFLQIKVLRVLTHLKCPSDELDDLLSSIVTGVDVRRNTGRSLLLATVETIGVSAKKPSLRSLAFNQVGRLFTFVEPNILYSALSSFSKILYSENKMLDRSSSDSLVLQRYKSQVVHCLDHNDASIRRRALDVVAALVDETNVETLIPEVMNYLHLADGDFRTELVAKIFQSIQRFAPSTIWNFDSVLKLIIDSGNYVGADVITSFCKLIAHQPDLRSHCLSALTLALAQNQDNQPLIQVASWAIGEFQEDPSDTIEIMTKLLNIPQTIVDTKCYLITALSKLATRFNLTEQIKTELEKFCKNNNLEIQQRSGEMVRILARTDLAEQLLAPIEVEDVEQPAINVQSGTSAPAPAPAGPSESADDLLLLDLGTPSPAPAATAPVAGPADDLLGDMAPTAPPVKKEIVAPPNAVEALRTSDYVIYFEIQRNPNVPSQVAIRSTVFNNGEIPLNNFIVQYGVPQGWVISAQPPSSTTLDPIGGRPIQQVIFLQNRGPNPLMMKTQTQYMYRSQPIKEMGEVNPIF